MIYGQELIDLRVFWRKIIGKPAAQNAYRNCLFLITCLASTLAWFQRKTNMQRRVSIKQGKILIPSVLTISLIFLFFGFFQPSVLYAAADTSLRTDLNFNYTISKHFKSTSYAFIQINDHVSDFNYFEWGTGIQYQTSLKWLSFLLFYQQGYSKDNDDNWTLEHRPSININTAGAISIFKISNQIRYEYRINQDWDDYRIKNTLVVSTPKIFLQPSLCWELYYENHDKDIMLHRFKLGITRNISEHVSIGPYIRFDFGKVDNDWKLTRQLFGFHVTINY